MTIDRQPGFLLGCVACAGIAASGCGVHSPPATVTGRVVAEPGDRPLSGLMVTYLPDPSRNARGRRASDVTDRAGRYELIYREAPSRPGAEAGWHKVVIEDFAAENRRGSRSPQTIRVPPEYQKAATTPLEVKVEPGAQTIDLRIETESGTGF